MPPIRRKSIRRTTWMHRHDALSQRDILVANRLRSSIAVEIQNSQETLSLMYTTMAISIMNDRNGVNDLTADGITALCLALFADQAQAVHDQLVHLIHIEYSLNDARTQFSFRQHRNRRINDITDSWAYQYTRFSKRQLRVLLTHWRLPEFLWYQSDDTHMYREPSETCMIVALAYISTGFPLIHLFDTLFGGCPRHWGRMIATLVSFICCYFFNKVCGMSMNFFAPRLPIICMEVLCWSMAAGWGVNRKLPSGSNSLDTK